jgi:hypothetical protein
MMRCLKLPGLWACAGFGVDFGTRPGFEFGFVLLPKASSGRAVTTGLVRVDASIRSWRRMNLTVKFGSRPEFAVVGKPWLL